jgi:flagellar export protein FliJ
MSKYKFRLATLQKLREARRNQERTALAEAFRAEQILAEHRAALAAEQLALRGLQRDATAGRYLDVDRLLDAQRYELVLKSRELELAGQKELLAVETERRRQAVVEADREVRVLELLDERHRRQHQRNAERQEIKQFDEAALNRHVGQAVPDNLGMTGRLSGTA